MNKLNFIEYLIDQNVLLNVYNSDLKNPLILSVENNAIDCLDYIVKYYKDYIDHKDKNGNSALIIACYFGYKECVEILLSNGANPNIQNNVGSTSAHLTSNIDILRLLIQYGCDITLLDNYNRSIVFSNCLNGNSEIVDYLLDLHISFLYEKDVYKNTLFHAACFNNSYNTVEVLLKYSNDFSCINESLCSPIDVLPRNLSDKIRDLLLSYKNNNNVGLTKINSHPKLLTKNYEKLASLYKLEKPYCYSTFILQPELIGLCLFCNKNKSDIVFFPCEHCCICSVYLLLLYKKCKEKYKFGPEFELNRCCCIFINIIVCSEIISKVNNVNDNNDFTYSDNNKRLDNKFKEAFRLSARELNKIKKK